MTEHEDHTGHEEMHRKMSLILIVSLIASQFALNAWKRLHPPSFQWSSLLGLWIVPPLLAFRAGNNRFLLIWALVSLATFGVVRKAIERPLKTSTPAQVFQWFAGVYTISYAVGMTGYVAVVLGFFRIPEIVLRFSGIFF
jgi:RING finger protein 121